MSAQAPAELDAALRATISIAEFAYRYDHLRAVAAAQPERGKIADALQTTQGIQPPVGRANH